MRRPLFVGDYTWSVDHIDAHEACSNHRAQIEASEVCGCFYCLETYPPTAIQDWCDDDEGTALCARCGIDSVIGSASGWPVTPEFLAKMNQHWSAMSDTVIIVSPPWWRRWFGRRLQMSRGFAAAGCRMSRSRWQGWAIGHMSCMEAYAPPSCMRMRGTENVPYHHSESTGGLRSL